jgi:phosphatidylinositol glycan class V
MQLWSRPVDHPIRNLLILFAGWKAFLLLIAALSPGPGYDTSSSLNATSHSEFKELPSLLRHVVHKLTRWDALYFVKVANRGYLFEQEWAFGWGFTRVIAFCTSGQ